MICCNRLNNSDRRLQYCDHGRFDGSHMLVGETLPYLVETSNTECKTDILPEISSFKTAISKFSLSKQLQVSVQNIDLEHIYQAQKSLRISYDMTSNKPCVQSRQTYKYPYISPIFASIPLKKSLKLFLLAIIVKLNKVFN